ncbi:MAG: hypothetical protein Q4C64_07315 [Erysipelotrichia bacterium]|nr:hypothetical protein [Erysipelotrichia bacterium]
MLSWYTIDELIELEKNDSIFQCSKEDKKIMNKIFKEIIELSGTDYQYVSELYYYNIENAGKVISKYIFELSSEEIKARISFQMLYPKRVKNCAEINLKLYKYFRETDYYKIADIPFFALSYDWRLSKLRPKRMKDELYELIVNPKDAFYLQSAV